MRRTIVGGVAVATGIALALSGCGGPADPVAGPIAKPSAAASATAPGTAQLLGQSYRKIESESFRFTSTVDVDGVEVTAEGAFDLATKVGVATVDMTGQELELRILGEDLYVSMMGQWMHADLRKLPAGSIFGDAANPVRNADFLIAASDDVKRTGKGTYQGTLNLEKYAEAYATPEQKGQLDELLASLGPEARTVPFTATVDEQGRLTRLGTTMKLTRDGERVTVRQETAYSDFGTKVEVTKPTGQIREAPDGIYRP